MVVALQDKQQRFVDDYLEGRISNPKRRDFNLAYNELLTSLKLDSGKYFISPSDSIRLNFLRARALAASNNPKDWDTGLKLITAALKNDSSAAYMYHTRGILFENKGRYFSAIGDFNKALKFAPNWQYIKYNLGTAYYELQEYEKSIKYFSDIAKTDSNYWRVYSWLAYNYETIADSKDNNYTKAIWYNDKAIQIDSANTYAYLNLGRIYLKMPGNYKINIDRAKYFLKIGGLKYNDSHCLTMLGKLYAKAQNADSAEYCFKQALSLNVFDTSALDGYAYFLHNEGNTIKADSIYRKFLDTTKHDYKFYSRYKSFVFKTKSPAAAEDIFDNIIHINHEDPSIFIEHSQQWESIDSLTKAKQALLSGMFYIPNSPSLNYAMARLYFTHLYDYFSGSSLDSSLHYLRIVQSIDSQYSLLDFALGQLYQAQNKTDSAMIYDKKASSLNKYVGYTNNFNNNLILSGNLALQKGKFTDATIYYRLADNLIQSSLEGGTSRIDRKFVTTLNY